MRGSSEIIAFPLAEAQWLRYIYCIGRRRAARMGETKMARRAGIMKNDGHAQMLWGEIYDATPKSVFATVCWHLANVASGEADNPGAAEARFAEELRALMHGHIPESQARRPHNLAAQAATNLGFVEELDS